MIRVWPQAWRSATSDITLARDLLLQVAVVPTQALDDKLISEWAPRVTEHGGGGKVWSGGVA